MAKYYYKIKEGKTLLYRGNNPYCEVSEEEFKVSEAEAVIPVNEENIKESVTVSVLVNGEEYTRTYKKGSKLEFLQESDNSEKGESTEEREEKVSDPSESKPKVDEVQKRQGRVSVAEIIKKRRGRNQRTHAKSLLEERLMSNDQKLANWIHDRRTGKELKKRF